MIARTVLGALLASSCATAFALSASEVFEKVAPSVWAVRGLDAQERPFSYGSGVVIAKGRLVTNCHVLAKAKAIQVRRENVMYEAKLEHADAERDLCILDVPNLPSPPVAKVAMAQLKVGQRVYAIGNPERLALTLSEGLISGLRTEDPKLPPVQTTAPISPGSSGGGLFDEQGRLVAITTLMVLGRTMVAQNLNFAAPAEWIDEVPERAKQQLAAHRPAAGQSGTAGAAARPAAEGLPQVGALWKYSLQDRQYSKPERRFSVRITGVEGWTVRESLQFEGRGEIAAASLDVQELRFALRNLGDGLSMIELAPYLLASQLAKQIAVGKPAAYPLASTFGWNVEAGLLESDFTVVPAGNFNTMKLRITGYSTGAQEYARLTAPGRFEYTAWYAPEVGRYVMVRHRVWDLGGTPIGDDVVQLVEYSAK